MEIDPLPPEVELPPEEGETFAENALGKARAAHAATGRTAIADDSGIEAYGLAGRPGCARPAMPGRTPPTRRTLAKPSRRSGPSRTGGGVRLRHCAGGRGPVGVPVRGRCEGTLAREPRGSGGFGYDPAFLPDDTGPDDERTMAELAARREARDQPPGASRAQAGRAPGHRGAVMSPATAASDRITKPRAAAVSIASNSSLIALKLAAAAITGSVAILSEALHSMIDLIASVIAFVSVRRADEPADVDHPYGHENLESLAASIEGMLILAGATLIVYESVIGSPRGRGAKAIGIAVIGFSALANVGVSVFSATGAPHRSSAGDAAHPGTDAPTSFGVLVGWRSSRSREPHGSTRRLRSSRDRHRLRKVRIMRQSARHGRRSPGTAEMDRIEGAIARACLSRLRCLPSQAPGPQHRAPHLHRPARAVPQGHSLSAPMRSPTGCGTRSSPTSGTPRC